MNKCTLRFMHKEVRRLSAPLSSNSRSSGNFHPNKESKISKSKLGSSLFTTKSFVCASSYYYDTPYQLPLSILHTELSSEW